jgi:putative hydrolase of the HAD superfamily
MHLAPSKIIIKHATVHAIAQVTTTQMAIQAVFFDAAGTLIKTTKSVGESYSAIAEKYGMRVTPAELLERFRVCFDGASPLAFPGAQPATISELERDWWKRIVREVFSPFGLFHDFDGYFDELFAHFARAESWVLYPDAGEVLRALSQRGLTLAVVSNFDSRLIDILQGLGVADRFDGIFVSSAMGYAKPDRRIFDAILNARRLVPEQVLHVGDSIANDIAGAANAGIKGILIDRKGACETAGITRVASLKEILEHLN